MIKKVKMSEEFIKLLQENNYRFDNQNKKEYALSKEKEIEILATFGFNENDDVEINDFFEFSKYFGFDKRLYLIYKPLKREANVTWSDIKNIRYGDIDFQNQVIYFPNQKVKSSKKISFDR